MQLSALENIPDKKLKLSEETATGLFANGNAMAFSVTEPTPQKQVVEVAARNLKKVRRPTLTNSSDGNDFASLMLSHYN